MVGSFSLLSVFDPFPFQIAKVFYGWPLAKVQFNDVVVIAGCGPIGLGMIAAAKMKSPKSIIALGKALALNINHFILLPNILYIII